MKRPLRFVTPIFCICFMAILISTTAYSRSIQVEPETEIGNLTQVSTEKSLEAYPAWSKDGRSILFVTDRFGGLGICKIDKSGGGGVLQVTAAPSELDGDKFPEVNPKSDEILFVSTRSRGVSQIFTVFPGNRGLTQLTSMPLGVTSPSWSPDGKQIAFSSPDKNNNWYVWIMSADGSNLRQVTPGMGPRWSPDGGRIVFCKLTQSPENRSNNWDIYIINVDGSGLTQITSDETHEIDPDWSPDGNWLCYTSVHDRIAVPAKYKDQLKELRKTRNFEIWVKNVGSSSGRKAIQLTRSSGLDIHPRWSPDGKQIAFASDRGGSLDIWCMTPNIMPSVTTP